MADLLAEGDKSYAMDEGEVLDIGTGANGIYLYWAAKCVRWQFVASDINAFSTMCEYYRAKPCAARADKLTITTR